LNNSTVDIILAVAKQKIMNHIKVLLQLLNNILSRATEVDEDGVEYFEDFTIPSCELHDLSKVKEKAEDELASKREERLWEVFRSLVAAGYKDEDAYTRAFRTVSVYHKLTEGKGI
jgi:hypothetical protein